MGWKIIGIDGGLAGVGGDDDGIAGGAAVVRRQDEVAGEDVVALEEDLIARLKADVGGMAVDLGDVPPQWARRVPLAFWFRFRRAVENTPTVLVVLDQAPYAKTCASLVLRLEPHAAQFSVFTCQLSVNRRGKAFN